MNKLNLILTASLLPLAVSATSTTNYSGVYVGAGFGTNILSTSQKFTFDPSKVANTAKYNFVRSTTNAPLLGQLYLGYGYLLPSKPIYAAIEAIAEFSHPATTIASSADISVKQNNAYGGRVKLGYVNHFGLAYVLAGLEGTSINRNVSFRNVGMYSGTMTLQNINGTNKNSTITQVGAGINIPVNTNWMAQVEYAHNFYNDKDYNINHKFITYNNPKGTYTSSLDGNQVTLGVKYIWNR